MDDLAFFFLLFFPRDGDTLEVPSIEVKGGVGRYGKDREIRGMG